MSRNLSHVYDHLSSAPDYLGLKAVRTENKNRDLRVILTNGINDMMKFRIRSSDRHVPNYDTEHQLEYFEEQSETYK
jgi:hypothetical protein